MLKFDLYGDTPKVMKFFILSLLFCSVTLASSIKIPAVALSQFKVGNTWSWSYFEKGDFKKWYSTEKYTVVRLKGTELTFELWTLYNGAAAYTPSAKFTLNLKSCFQAFMGPTKQNFNLKIYAYENGNWSKTSYDVPSTAFEEKFNCNSKYYQNPEDSFITFFKNLETSEGFFKGFQQYPKSNSSQIRSFYFYDHPKLRGIAFQKTFNPDLKDFFEMRLTNWRMQ